MKSIAIENDTQEEFSADNSSRSANSASNKSGFEVTALGQKEKCEKIHSFRKQTRLRFVPPYSVFKLLTKEEMLSLQSLFEALLVLEKQLAIEPGLPPQGGQAKTIASTIKMSTLMARRANCKAGTHLGL
jgi:hypothetical protein